MKKIFISLLCLFVVIAFCGCIPHTEYDDLEISKIESGWIEGFGPFPRRFVRTFDFTSGEVTDTWVTDFEDISEEQWQFIDIEKYNNPELVTTFSEENAQEFIKRVKSLGFYTWKESYKTNDIICDGGSECVTVYFSDGTKKSTSIYFKDPPNYTKILSAFEDYLGAKLYLGW